jgi:hypothetical protein
MNLDLSLTPCSGLAPGPVYQFAEGEWPGPIGASVVLCEGAFDFILPRIQSAWPDWDGAAMYGVTGIAPQSCTALIAELRWAADRLLETRRMPEWAGYSDRFTAEEVGRHFEENPARLDDLSELLRNLANWLEAALTRGAPLSLLGI